MTFELVGSGLSRTMPVAIGQVFDAMGTGVISMGTLMISTD